MDAGHWFEDTLLTLTPDTDDSVRAAQRRGEEVMQRVVDLVDFVQNEVLRAVSQARRGKSMSLKISSALFNIITISKT